MTPPVSARRHGEGRGSRDPSLPYEVFLSQVRQAMRSGATIQGNVVHWSLDSFRRKCVSPVFIRRVVGEGKHALFFGLAERGTPIGAINYYGRCRKCETCRANDRAQWIARTIYEARITPGRIWFVTVTLETAMRDFVEAKAKLLALREGVKFDVATMEQQFQFRAVALRGEISLYLKRIRKGVGKKASPKIRFLCVTEPHKDFQPHAHLLVFEHGHPVGERDFRHRWAPRGFVQAELVHGVDKVARYVSKYLTKDFRGTIHASIRFGSSKPPPP